MGLLSTVRAKLLPTSSAIATSQLRLLNIWTAAIYALEAAAVLLLSSGQSYPVAVGFLASSPLASEETGKQVLVTATHHLLDLSIAHVLAAGLLILAVVHALLASVLRERYEAQLKRGTSWFRWIGVGLGLGLLGMVTGVLVGVSDVALLMLIAGGVLGAAVTHSVAELFQQTKGKPVWVAYAASAVVGLLPWLAVGWYVWAGGLYAASSFGHYAYFVVATLLAGCVVQMVITALLICKRGAWKQYAYGERASIVLWLLVVTAVISQLYVGVLQP